MSILRRRWPGALYPTTTVRMMDPAKQNALTEVRLAVQQGRLTKRPCQACGRKRGVEAHHDNYAAPLAVIWLCRPCHRRRDKALKIGTASALPIFHGTPRIQREKRRFITTTPVAGDLVQRTTLGLVDAMRQEGMSENHLSQLLGSSRQYVNTLFAGGFRTLKSVAIVADKLGYEVHIGFHRRACAPGFEAGARVVDQPQETR